jgi:hypothetical protein
MKTDAMRRCDVLLALQHALLGEVPAQLRAVTVSYDDTSIMFQSYFDGAITDEDRESMSLVETELMAAFPSTHTIGHDIIRLDVPALVPKDRTWVYHRKERLPR